MLKIKIVRDATTAEWDEYWNCSESGTFFHSREWAEIWQSYSNGKMYPVPLLITFSDGKKALLPIMQQRYYQGLIKRNALTGPPFISKYGNWLTKDHLNKHHISLITAFVIDNIKNLTWQLNPFDVASTNIMINSKYVRRIPHTAYMVDLTKGEEIIYSNIKKSCLNHIKQGIENKLKIIEGPDIEDWKKYYDIYRDTIIRWGSKTPYILHWRLFEIIYSRMNPIIKLWLVWYGDIPIAGSINFYSHGKIIGWHMASLTDYRHLRPNHLLEYSMIKDGIYKNYQWYDMGTDGGNKGLQNFKRSFGPEKVMCDKIYTWQPVIYHMKRVKNYFEHD